MTEANRHVREDLDEVPYGQVLVSTSCWSCEAWIRKEVPARQRNHQHFSWSCEACDVAWTGPGSHLAQSA
jgi:hypothetical protein